MKKTYSIVKRSLLEHLFSGKSVNSFFKLLLSAILILYFSASCSKESPKGEYEDGVYVINEGTSNNGSVSFYNYGSDEVFNDVFQSKNKRPLGTFVQSIKLHQDNAYIIVNGSNKVEVVDRYTMQEKGTIENVSSPRYMEAKGNKGYVSCWKDNSIKVIDLDSKAVSKSITVASGPEKMLIKNDLLYVTNSGGYSYDSIVSVIDLNTEEVIKSIQTGDKPIDLVEDNSGYIWVLCAGKTVYSWEPPYDLLEESPSKIVKIDPETNNAVLEISLFDNQHPESMETDSDGSYLYFGGGYFFQGIYKLDVSLEKPTATKIVNKIIYGFNIDRQTNVIFAGFSPDFSKSGTLKRYSLIGEELGSYTVGVGPNGTALKKAK